jgi:hypothetical protein
MHFDLAKSWKQIDLAKHSRQNFVFAVIRHQQQRHFFESAENLKESDFINSIEAQ